MNRIAWSHLLNTIGKNKRENCSLYGSDFFYSEGRLQSAEEPPGHPVPAPGIESRAASMRGGARSLYESDKMQRVYILGVLPTSGARNLPTGCMISSAIPAHSNMCSGASSFHIGLKTQGAVAPSSCQLPDCVSSHDVSVMVMMLMGHQCPPARDTGGDWEYILLRLTASCSGCRYSWCSLGTSAIGMRGASDQLYSPIRLLKSVWQLEFRCL